MIPKAGLFGLGETIIRDNYRIVYGIDLNDSVGLLSMTYTYGILFTLYYLFASFSAIKRFFRYKSIFEALVLATVFIVLHLTEGIWFLPVYLYIIFGSMSRY